MIEQVSGWIAPLATAIGAVMTAANLGPRVTGWGFVVFTLGSAAWCVEALLTHQPNLLWSNAFLGIVDAIGVYRWLARRARLEDGAEAAAEKSKANTKPLFPVSSLDGAALEGKDGSEVARIVGAMATCDDGRMEYLVVRSGGVARSDAFRAVAWHDIICGDPFRTRLTPSQIAALPVIDPSDWPARTPPNPDGRPGMATAEG